MIVLCDAHAKVYSELYHVSDDGVVTAVRYSHNQIYLAKEHIPRGAPFYKRTPAAKPSWIYVPEPGVTRARTQQELPKPLQLYLMLLED
jgi:hypothetical protein